MKNILVTGCAGFIGSNFVPYFLDKYPEYNIINLDLLTYAGSLENLVECEGNPRYKFIKGDICNRELVEFIFNEYDIRGIIHFAAESHVDNSIKNPGVFVQTNVNGTFTLLDVAYKYWMEKPFTYRHSVLDTESTPRFHHISTDEVYGTLSDDPNDLFTEKTPYAPNSPYSASKASSDMIVRSYVETYGMNCVITNCSNNYGPKQHDEKFIPTIIRNALAGNPIPIYGDGKNIRDWLYVLDHCKGIDLVYHTGKKGETYNIGGRNERTNLQIVDRICAILDEIKPRHCEEQSDAAIQESPRHSVLDTESTSVIASETKQSITSYKSLITFVQDRAGHDRRYAIDATKIETELGWKADENFDTGIVKTVEWYLNKYGINK
ncbi:MAG: spore coat protein [Sulfurovum sp. AS07-7]|nr:MAG: spore coat protein [Sulfurovum sp. AS07-7]